METSQLKVFVNQPSKNSKKEISLLQMFSDFLDARFLGKQMFLRDIKAMFRQSLLGIIWAIFPPFLSAGLWVFLNSTGAVNITDSGVPYPIFVMCGTVLYSTFTHALNMPADAVMAGKGLMAKLNFPREALLINAFYKVLFDFTLKFMALVLIALILGFSFGWATLLFPLGALVAILFGFSFGVFLIPFKMLYGDFKRLLSIATQVLMYATPIVYPMPESGIGRLFNAYNPIYYMTEIPRSWFTNQNTPDLWPFCLIAGVSLLVLFFGWVLYRITMPIIVERVGA
ncbi:ABC transporter permease [Mangrovimonas sp. AS39]|uniref:ABC transporter permease n=1 Tax=Mangrovimonas futianensis TaxID=2895523 RepID=UPI001E407AF2|nr:ABC transporter permease [Mangrovimonas futianensis]MCF1190824.1 ABC transporter permease [Mangrovimonas futianensis]MCF1194521.1 ABC transporter permease [Mangrovimonas futianensis]